MSNLWARLARLRVDVSPLRDSRDFRLLFWAGTVFYLGGMVSYVALPYQLYQLTGSNFAVGALGIVELVPLVVFGLYGGALADHVDRRLMLVVTGAAQVLLTAALMANAFLSAPRLGSSTSWAPCWQQPARCNVHPERHCYHALFAINRSLRPSLCRRSAARSAGSSDPPSGACCCNGWASAGVSPST